MGGERGMGIGWLLLAWLIGRRAPTQVARAIATVLAVAAGLTLPDLDQWLPLAHRSALTHSVLPVLLVLGVGRGVAAGVALGLGFHLAADCFPAAMAGYATVKLPFAGSIGAGWSYVWLGVQSIGCSLWGAWSLARDEPPGVALGVLGVGAALGAVYLWHDPGGWPALLLYGAAGFWVWWRGKVTR